MFEIVVTEEFETQYQGLSSAIQKKMQKQEKIFRLNPHYPSLRVEKLIPKNKEVWSFRVDRKYRVLFRFVDGKTALFLAVGSHDWIYSIKF